MTARYILHLREWDHQFIGADAHSWRKHEAFSSLKFGEMSGPEARPHDSDGEREVELMSRGSLPQPFEPRLRLPLPFQPEVDQESAIGATWRNEIFDDPLFFGGLVGDLSNAGRSKIP